MKAWDEDRIADRVASLAEELAAAERSGSWLRKAQADVGGAWS